MCGGVTEGVAGVLVHFVGKYMGLRNACATFRNLEFHIFEYNYFRKCESASESQGFLRGKEDTFSFEVAKRGGFHLQLSGVSKRVFEYSESYVLQGGISTFPQLPNRVRSAGLFTG